MAAVLGHKKLSQLLKDMRAVYRQDVGRDSGPGQALCRELRDKNPEKFMELLARLETSHKSQLGKQTVAASEAKKDKPLPEDRMVGVIDRLLQEYANDRPGESAG